MNQREEIESAVREILVEILALEPEEVTTKSRFFSDLGGESIEVLELSFHCEKRFGVPIKFQELSHASRGSGEKGILTDEDVAALRKDLPFLDWPTIEAQGDLSDPEALFTVDSIVRFVEHAIESHENASASR